MTTIAVVIVLVACFGLVLWAALRSARSAGSAEQRAEGLEHEVKAGERIADARDGAPRTVDDLDKRLQNGGHI